MWAIFAAPLLMSVDLRTIKPDYKAILQNRHIISVNQDRLGIQGRRIYKVRYGFDPYLSSTEALFLSLLSRQKNPVHAKYSRVFCKLQLC